MYEASLWYLENEKNLHISIIYFFNTVHKTWIYIKIRILITAFVYELILYFFSSLMVDVS